MNTDETLAREEVDTYYRQELDDALAAVTKAQAVLDQVAARRAEWETTGQLPDTDAPRVAWDSMSRHTKATTTGLSKPPTPELAEMIADFDRRQAAVRRWLTARGHNLYELALPAEKTGR